MEKETQGVARRVAAKTMRLWGGDDAFAHKLLDLSERELHEYKEALKCDVKTRGPLPKPVTYDLRALKAPPEPEPSLAGVVPSREPRARGFRVGPDTAIPVTDVPSKRKARNSIPGSTIMSLLSCERRTVDPSPPGKGRRRLSSTRGRVQLRSRQRRGPARAPGYPESLAHHA